MEPRWIKIPRNVGEVIWFALRPLLGDGVSVGASCTDPDGRFGSPYIMTELWLRDESLPLLRIETRWMFDGDEREHSYFVPEARDYEEDSLG